VIARICEKRPQSDLVKSKIARADSQSHRGDRQQKQQGFARRECASEPRPSMRNPKRKRAE
jgi:hypothetical protein